MNYPALTGPTNNEDDYPIRLAHPLLDKARRFMTWIVVINLKFLLLILPLCLSVQHVQSQTDPAATLFTGKPVIISAVSYTHLTLPTKIV